VYSRHRRWSGDGTWEVILDGLRVRCDLDEGSEWTVGVDATVIRGHQHAAGCAELRAGHRGLGRMTRIRRPRGPLVLIGRAWGAPAAGVSTKIHLLADARCRPLARVTTAGQRHDSLAFEPLMGRLRIRRNGRGRPRTRPGWLQADKAY
jgi:hypothetical protein